MLDRAFGPGRFAKSSERVREAFAAPDWAASRVAVEAGAVIGACRIWRIGVGGQAAAFLGPLGVEPAWRLQGLAQALIGAAVEATQADLILVVGAPALFAPFGFAPAPAEWRGFPEPVARARLLWRPLRPAAVLEGPITRPPGAS